ncbi:MAG TPA: putative peptidoglycan glycosyltransferase FtsW [Candidatus Saccharimonadales bacterium]
MGVVAPPRARQSAARSAGSFLRPGQAEVEENSLQARRHRPDYVLMLLMLALLAIGITVIYAISPALAVEKNVGQNYFVLRQSIAIALGLVMFVVAAKVPLRTWRQLFPTLLIVAGLATLVALVMPVSPDYPAHRWIRLGGFSFQSVELLKLALIVWFADFLARRMREGSLGDPKKTLQPIFLVVIAVGLIVAGVQSDLGSTGVIVAIMGAMAFVAGLPMKRLMLIVGIVAIGTILAVSAIPYRRERLLTFLHPEQNCLTTSWQECQALIAVGSGGAIGLGLGRSVQAYGYLPEAENDAIFAIYAEKFGFVGATILLALFVAFFARLRRIIDRAPDNFSRLVVTGVLIWLAVQAFVNIGAMIGLLPLKGITLPLISYGGSSVLLTLAALGLVFQISRYTKFSVETNEGANYASSRNRRR